MTLNWDVVKQYIMRLVGYGAAAASGYVATKLDPNVGAAVGGLISIGGAAVMNKALPYIIPTVARVEQHVSLPKIPLLTPPTFGLSPPVDTHNRPKSER